MWGIPPAKHDLKDPDYARNDAVFRAAGSIRRIPSRLDLVLPRIYVRSPIQCQGLALARRSQRVAGLQLREVTMIGRAIAHSADKALSGVPRER